MSVNRAPKSGFAAEAQRKVSADKIKDRLYRKNKTTRNLRNVKYEKSINKQNESSGKRLGGYLIKRNEKI